jgi:hypothetical protein
MVRKDKKSTTCNRCGRTLATPQKLREHLNRKNPCKPQASFITENKLFQEEIDRLGDITGEYDKELVFRERELGFAKRRRAVAKYNAIVPKHYPSNGNDIRKMLESQKKSLCEILKKEFDKRGQFKFALCSLTKFLIGENEKNSRTDWLRNKQIIVYNRSEIDSYVSDAIEQIVNQAEERGGA